jgi:hypothetical protein
LENIAATISFFQQRTNETLPLWRFKVLLPTGAQRIFVIAFTSIPSLEHRFTGGTHTNDHPGILPLSHDSKIGACKKSMSQTR